RKDIAQVFERIDIYFNTYPYGGGLMLQYAVQSGKPPISLWKKGLANTRLDYVFDCYLPENHIIEDKSSFLKIAGSMIDDKSFREEYTKWFEAGRQSMDKFCSEVSDLLKGHSYTPEAISDIEIDQQAITNFHVN